MPAVKMAFMHSKEELWERFKRYYIEYPSIGLSMDISRMAFAPDFFSTMEGPLKKAFQEMADLERGGIANIDENRMVGHYWLRNPALAPSAEIKRQIEECVVSIKDFAAQVHQGRLHGSGGSFKNVLLIGIGGSALGPQFVSHALGQPGSDKMDLLFFDNTDPDGMDRTLAQLGGELNRTLCVVISKSGGTKETRNGMLEAKAAYERADLDFGRYAVAVTGEASELDRFAIQHQWLARFPMWDWVGGRTSELSAVGLLPAALQGIKIDGLLEGARRCDEVTRENSLSNPSVRLALMWFHAGRGKGLKDMVVLPYKDRLELFSRYLQQLVMESLGKELDRAGELVNQGLAVYGNKGSTDQHAYVQQLRDGLNNFFVIFIGVQRERDGELFYVEPDATSGDYLHGFLLGTRQALADKGRESITITLEEVSEQAIGTLIALFERAVGYYASIINVNAYHQPGVEAGKKAAEVVLGVQHHVLEFLRSRKGEELTLAQIADAVGAHTDVEAVFRICEHLCANSNRHVRKRPGKGPFDAAYFFA